MNYKKTAARFFWLSLPIAILSFAINLSVTESCHAQRFTGNGDGSSWFDASNWSSSNLPFNPDIFSQSEIGYSVQLNSTVEVGRVEIRSSEHEGVFRTASLSVNSPLSAADISCDGERGFFNMNANVNMPSASSGSLHIAGGATLNLNSGMLTAPILCFGRSFSDASSTFNQNGGNFNVRSFNIECVNTTATIGPNDNVTGDISIFGGNLTCDRSLVVDRIALCDQTTLTVNHDLSATNSFNVTVSTENAIPPTLIWNDGDITTPSFQIEGVVNRIGGGRLMVENFNLTRSFASSMSTFVIREDDIISGTFSISAAPDFSFAAIFEGPHGLERIIQSQHSVVNYQQALGETAGLALGSYSNSINSSLNLGFDSQSVGGLDWVLRVDGNEVEDLEEMIEDGRIVVTGADFAVEYDAVNDVTYIQQSNTTVLGDVNQDGEVNFLDISPFIARLSTGGFQQEADIDSSGAVNFLDIVPFIRILSGQ